MNFRYVRAIVLRQLLLTFRDMNRILNILYWPFINILLLGMMGMWLGGGSQSGNSVLILVSTAVFWDIAIMITIQVANNLLSEILDRNLINVFTTPISIYEWIVADIIICSINVLLLVTFSSLIIRFIFGLNIFSMGIHVLTFIGSLMLSGFFIGFFLCGLVIYLGKRSIDLVYFLGWLFAPFCAVYYPLRLLPETLQLIAKALPMTYTFESMRELLTTGNVCYSEIIISYVLSIVYLILAISFFKYMFEKGKVNGLANLE